MTSDAFIHLDDVSLDIPVFDHKSRSLKKNLLRGMVGSSIAESDGQRYIRALDGISLDAKRGERIGLVGHNGAGKTTLLKTIAGIYQPTGGRLETQGSVTALIDIAAGVNMDASGYENILIRGLYLGHRLSEIHDRMDHIVAFSELGEYINMPLRTYSSGMLSRLLFSVSTAFEPDILLLDEGIIAGDAAFNEKASDYLAGFTGSAGIVILASHSKELMQMFCTRGIKLKEGTIVGVGEVEELF
jgi:ABC-2 type transport system ATP-binding protein/lipopolysaccharide transport system ATP-binding protein